MKRAKPLPQTTQQISPNNTKQQIRRGKMEAAMGEGGGEERRSSINQKGLGEEDVPDEEQEGRTSEGIQQLSQLLTIFSLHLSQEQIRRNFLHLQEIDEHQLYFRANPIIFVINYIDINMEITLKC
ncbi:hypothetical protein VPH35_083937 [Triticum aestivum]